MDGGLRVTGVQGRERDGVYGAVMGFSGGNNGAEDAAWRPSSRNCTLRRLFTAMLSSSASEGPVDPRFADLVKQLRW